MAAILFDCLVRLGKLFHSFIHSLDLNPVPCILGIQSMFDVHGQSETYLFHPAVRKSS